MSKTKKLNDISKLQLKFEEAVKNNVHHKLLDDVSSKLLQYEEERNSLLKKIEEQQFIINQLQNQLQNNRNIPTFEPVLTSEELIANQQLEYLKKLSLERPLTLDEVKRFDLLVKNKRLAQGDSTDILDYKKKKSKLIDKSKLLEIATNKTFEDKTIDRLDDD